MAGISISLLGRWDKDMGSRKRYVCVGCGMSFEDYYEFVDHVCMEVEVDEV